MIVDSNSQIALSCLGWVDHGSLWAFDFPANASRHIELSDARYVAASRSKDGTRFAVSHHYAGQRWGLTAHLFAEPESPLAELKVDGRRPHLDGELSAFAGLPSLYVTYLNDDAAGAAGYYLVDLSGRHDQVRRLDWLNGEEYDLDYQGVISVLDVPGEGYLFSVQRSSNLVLCDSADLRVLATVPLGDRMGNPRPAFLADGRRLIAVDYDTVVVVEVSTWKTTARWLGQPPRPDGHRMFLGDAWLSDDGAEIIVARPGSGDVVHLDSDALTPRDVWRTGRQPLDAAKLRDKIIARDWKSGDLLTASAQGR